MATSPPSEQGRILVQHLGIFLSAHLHLSPSSATSAYESEAHRSMYINKWSPWHWCQGGTGIPHWPSTTCTTEPTGPPTAFHAVVLNSTAIEVQWNLPLSNLRNGFIRGYKFFVQRENQEEKTYDIRSSRTTKVILFRLDPGTAYIVSVLAYTVGDGPRSIHLMVITPLVSE